ncbi:MAG: AAA family ATPase [Bacteroidales bacterium]|nr:AAA family ATPase [Bacteroidales bacterium]
MAAFEKGEYIDDRYLVVFPLSQNGGTEVYRVRDEQHKLHFVTLYNHDLLPADAFDEHGVVKVVAMRRSVSHPNLCAYEDSGTIVRGERQFDYIVTQFVSCETLAARLQRNPEMKIADVRQLVLSILRLLRYLHTLPQPVAHGQISKKNILLDLTGNISDIKLTDFSLQCQPATESDIKADLREVGKLLYSLCFGKEAQQPPRLPNVTPAGMDESLLNVIAMALGDEGFGSADQMLKAMLGTIEIARPSGKAASQQDAKKKGNGFADVAGMDDLKKLLNESVLYVLRDQERARRYNLDIPNGMLLYGPPGCGKTFIAERFAEEAGFNFKFVKTSDLASIYIHGTQGLIGNLFDEARAKAPTVICFDEFEAMASNRTNHHNANMSGEVNELLSQLNNCGKDRVFVIATSNQPDLIDPAILRVGRMDHIIYVPMPDDAARMGIFKIHLENRPCANDIDYRRLALLTKNYIASEIAYVCNKAALEASRTDSDISNELLVSIVQQTKPRTTRETQQYYERMQKRMENIQDERRTIGIIPR